MKTCQQPWLVKLNQVNTIESNDHLHGDLILGRLIRAPQTCSLGVVLQDGGPLRFQLRSGGLWQRHLKGKQTFPTNFYFLNLPPRVGGTWQKIWSQVVAQVQRNGWWIYLKSKVSSIRWIKSFALHGTCRDVKSPCRPETKMRTQAWIWSRK